MILVTGATGMFGSRITTQLLARRAQRCDLLGDRWWSTGDVERCPDA